MALHVVEELLGAEVAALHRGDRPADHQVADRVEQPGAVHQRRGGHVARARLGDPVGDGLEVLLGWHALLVVRVEHAEQVVLAPHDALGHAGGAAGVEQQEVVARSAPGRVHVVVGAGAGGVLVRRGPLGARAGSVVDPQPQGDLGNPIADGLALVGERAVEHDGGGVGVVPEVHQLVGGVAVVGVDDGEARLEGGEDRLEVLRAVVEVLRDLVLFGRAGSQECRGDPVRTSIEVGPRVGASALLLCERVGDARRHGLPQVSEVPAGLGRRHPVDGSADPANDPGLIRGRVNQAGPGAVGRRRRSRGSARPWRPTSTRSTTWRRRSRTQRGSVPTSCLR